MHEMAIAVELVRQLEALAQEHHLKQVEVVAVKAGLLRQVVPEALEMAFAAMAEGTCAAGARLEFHVAPPLAKCRACECRFEPAVDDFLCPQCRQADVEIVEGNDIVLTSVTGQQQERDSRNED